MWALLTYGCYCIQPFGVQGPDRVEEVEVPDVVGYRAKFGVIVPSTNTVVEHDLNRLGPRGITFHTGRMYIEDPDLSSNDSFERLLGQIREAMRIAVRDVMTCAPDHLVMGMSAETFWGGLEGNRRFEKRVREMSGGLEVTTGATSCRRALEVLGAQRIAVLSPYQPVADEMVTGYFEDAGFEVVAFHGLRCPTATAIAEVSPRRLAEVLRALDDPHVEAIVQVGTNLSMVTLADAAEQWLAKPVLAINAVTLWASLRSNGFDDRFDGAGTLLREH
jgi:maleate isomerase